MKTGAVGVRRFAEPIIRFLDRDGAEPNVYRSVSRSVSRLVFEAETDGDISVGFSVVFSAKPDKLSTFRRYLVPCMTDTTRSVTAGTTIQGGL